MKMLRVAPLALAVVAAAGCEDNPILSPDSHDEEYNVAFSLSAEEISTLTEYEVEVVISDHDGAPVTEFEVVAFEYRMEGAQEWSSTELEFHGGHFSAEHMFYSSGEYEMRVVAQAHGAQHAEPIYEHDGHLPVERIHMAVGEYRVEMETFPGHVHEGDEAEVKFWVIEAAGGHGMGGLSASIHMDHEQSGQSTTHGAEEHAEGVYEALHTFAEHGETEVMIEFMDGHGENHQAAFHVRVAEIH